MPKESLFVKSTEDLPKLREQIERAYEEMSKDELIREISINNRLILDRLEVSLTEHRRIRNNLVFFAWVLIIVLIVEIVGAVI